MKSYLVTVYAVFEINCKYFESYGILDTILYFMIQLIWISIYLSYIEL